MSTMTRSGGAIREIEPVKAYSSSIAKVAKLRWAVDAGARATVFADELQGLDIPVVAVLDGDDRPLGILRADRLFALLGKPFGREILGRTGVVELMEDVPVFDAQEGIFAVAAEALALGSEEGSVDPDYCLLVDEEGRFRAILSTRDLSDYLSRITREDIELAGKIQERLLSGNEAIGGGDWALEAWSRSAKGVGGDFYFTRPLEDGRAFMALCDVSGKGVAASLVVSLAWGMLATCDFGKGLASLVKSLNQTVVECFHLEKYLTGVFAIFDPAARRLSIADMGHSHILVLRAGRSFVPKSDKMNLPIGIESGIEPRIASWLLSAGDRVMVYSDGLTEQVNQRGEEFGVKRLSSAAIEAFARGEELASALPPAIDAFRGRTPQQDDMSFIALSLAAGPAVR